MSQLVGMWRRERVSWSLCTYERYDTRSMKKGAFKLGVQEVINARHRHLVSLGRVTFPRRRCVPPSYTWARAYSRARVVLTSTRRPSSLCLKPRAATSAAAQRDCCAVSSPSLLLLLPLLPLSCWVTSTAELSGVSLLRPPSFSVSHRVTYARDLRCLVRVFPFPTDKRDSLSVAFSGTEPLKGVGGLANLDLTVIPPHISRWRGDSTRLPVPRLPTYAKGQQRHRHDYRRARTREFPTPFPFRRSAKPK